MLEQLRRSKVNNQFNVPLFRLKCVFPQWQFQEYHQELRVKTGCDKWSECTWDNSRAEDTTRGGRWSMRIQELREQRNVIDRRMNKISVSDRLGNERKSKITIRHGCDSIFTHAIVYRLHVATKHTTHWHFLPRFSLPSRKHLFYRAIQWFPLLYVSVCGIHLLSHLCTIVPDIP